MSHHRGAQRDWQGYTNITPPGAQRDWQGYTNVTPPRRAPRSCRRAPKKVAESRKRIPKVTECHQLSERMWPNASE
eukprot:2468628-Pyramimonas_sp.AAC.1